jgi:hypothetical protein
MQKMLSGTYADDYGTGFGGEEWNSSGSINGNVVPANESRAILLGMPPLPTDLLLPTRYVRFEFYADSGTNDDGWNISLQRSPLGVAGVLPGTISQRLYLDTGDFTKVKDTGVISLGYIAATDADNDSIYMRSLDFSVFDGATGPTGPIGPPGAKGDKGDQGIKGNIGTAGNDGAQGIQGIKGDIGTAGSDGSDGAKGDIGVAGANGKDGAPGATGAQGPQGEQGIPGICEPGMCGEEPPKRFTAGHNYVMGEDLTGQEGVMLVLRTDGKVYKSTTPSDKRVIGFLGEIVSGKDSLSNTEHSQLAFTVGLGDSYQWKTVEHVEDDGTIISNEIKNVKGVKVSNEGGDIDIGDLLVTSSVPGYLMKQTDNIVRSCTVGKCMQVVTFGGSTEKSEIYCIMMCG